MGQTRALLAETRFQFPKDVIFGYAGPPPRSLRAAQAVRRLKRLYQPPRCKQGRRKPSLFRSPSSVILRGARSKDDGNPHVSLLLKDVGSPYANCSRFNLIRSVRTCARS